MKPKRSVVGTKTVNTERKRQPVRSCDVPKRSPKATHCVPILHNPAPLWNERRVLDVPAHRFARRIVKLVAREPEKL
jgi:hypothetical protein